MVSRLLDDESTASLIYYEAKERRKGVYERDHRSDVQLCPTPLVSYFMVVPYPENEQRWGNPSTPSKKTGHRHYFTTRVLCCRRRMRRIIDHPRAVHLQYAVIHTYKLVGSSLAHAEQGDGAIEEHFAWSQVIWEKFDGKDPAPTPRTTIKRAPRERPRHGPQPTQPPSHGQPGRSFKPALQNHTETHEEEKSPIVEGLRHAPRCPRRAHNVNETRHGERAHDCAGLS